MNRRDFLSTGSLLVPAALSLPAAAAGDATALRAKYLITATDDFIVDAYLNGQAIPDEKRSLVMERFGATVERIDVEVKAGDWLVFNVVNNRRRWGGQYYFGCAGCFDKNEFGFHSCLGSGDWSACDSLKDVSDFIEDKLHLAHRFVEKVSRPWGEGDAFMRQFAGDRWPGQPVWGTGRNTWLKVIVR